MEDEHITLLIHEMMHYFYSKNKRILFTNILEISKSALNSEYTNANIESCLFCLQDIIAKFKKENFTCTNLGWHVAGSLNKCSKCTNLSCVTVKFEKPLDKN